MVNQTADISRIFRVLADPIRRRILSQLSETNGLTAGDIAEQYDVSWPAVTKHLRSLEESGLIRREVSGRTNRFFVQPSSMTEAAQWLNEYLYFWQSRLDSLDKYLNERKK